MNFQPRSHEKIRGLLEKGVDIPNPGAIDIGDEVNIDQISHQGIKIYPGCRIYGGKTVISSGCRLGHEGPLTIEDCQLGPRVELKGGFAGKSVFLEKANMSMGAHVREGCLLEEEANGAHCVGLKQTILFPFVTLGSLINFCDCLMAGGTSRVNHSEVGSSYIHFNYTPNGDKTTPSLLGDVPRGVMLNQPPIFLGGQGGMVGPLRVGYGNVVAAGSILRHDCLNDNQLIFEAPHGGKISDFVPGTYPNLRHILENNIFYMANLKALQAWYKYVRKPFFNSQEYGTFLYAGCKQVLSLAIHERIKRLKMMMQKVASSSTGIKPDLKTEKPASPERMDNIEEILDTPVSDDAIRDTRDAFLRNLETFKEDGRKSYIETIRSLPAETSAKGVLWLQDIVNYYCQKTTTMILSGK